MKSEAWIFVPIILVLIGVCAVGHKAAPNAKPLRWCLMAEFDFPTERRYLKQSFDTKDKAYGSISAMDLRGLTNLTVRPCP